MIYFAHLPIYHMSFRSSQNVVAIDLLRLKKQLVASASPAADWLIETTTETTSTNTDLIQRAKKTQHWTKPIVYVADWQTAGRGRLGRAWLAQPGQSLLCSIGITMPKSIEALSGLSLAIGTLLVDALQSLSNDNAIPKEKMQFGLKWPNDILLNEKKLGGVLIETVQKEAQQLSIASPVKNFFDHKKDITTNVVIGIGINLRNVNQNNSQAIDQDNSQTKSMAALDKLMQKNLNDQFQDTLNKPKFSYSPAFLTESIHDSENLRSDLLAKIIISLEKGLTLFNTHGFTPFIKPWWRWHAYSNRAVSIYENDKEILRGQATGIDNMGRLMISNGKGLHAVASGDLSLRSTESI